MEPIFAYLFYILPVIIGVLIWAVVVRSESLMRDNADDLRKLTKMNIDEHVKCHEGLAEVAESVEDLRRTMQEGFGEVRSDIGSINRRG